MKKILPFIFIVLFPFGILTITVGCSNVNKHLEVADSEIIGEEERTIKVGFDYPLSLNFKEAIAETDLIVTGFYGDLEKKWNMARDHKNQDLEDEKNYTEGLIYNFSIDEVLFSSRSFSEMSIPINLRHFKRMDVTFNDGTVEYIDYVDPFFIEPTSNQKYILLLRYSPTTGNYFAATEPFQFIVNENSSEITAISNIFDEKKSHVTNYGKVNIEGPSFDHITDQFSGTTIEELEQHINTVKRR